MSTEHVDKLVLLSIQKKNILEKFLVLTQEQKEVIKQDNTGSLESILSQKDSLIKDIDKLDILYLETYGELRRLENIESLSQIDTSKYENLRHLKETTLEISDLLSQIDLLDKENIKLIRDKVGDVKSDLRNVKTVQTAYKGYSNNTSGGSSSSMLIDERK